MALIPSDPRQRNALVVAVLLLAGLYFFWSYWYSPRAEEADQMAERLEQLENQNRQAQIIAARGGRQLEERMVQYERHVARLEQLIPAREEVSQLLEDISREARTHGVELASLRPGGQQPNAYYTLQTYDLSVVGEYHDVAEFLTSIASLPRIITPRNVEIQRFGNPQGAQQDFEAPIVAEFQIETYVLPPEGQAPAGAAAGGGPGGTE